MEREVPRRVPRVLPLVRHRDDVGVEHVEPLGVPHARPGRLEQRMALVLAQPPLEVEVVELLAPQHARQRLAVHPALVLGQRLRRDPLVELVRVARSGSSNDPVEVREGVGRPGGREPQADRLAAAGGHVEHVVGRGLGARPARDSPRRAGPRRRTRGTRP